MLGVVQLVERQIVTLKVVVSKPTAHPIAMSSSEFPRFMVASLYAQG